MAFRGHWMIAAGLAAMAAMPAWAGAEKPAGGICECGPYSEAPAACAPLAGSKRQVCISANLQWLDKCTTWRSTICHATSVLAEPVKTPPPAVRGPVAQTPPAAQASPPPAPPSAMPPPPVIASSALTTFGGTWTGEAQCQRGEKWRLAMSVAQLADGSLLTSAMTGLMAGSITKVELTGNDVVLHFSSWIAETLYKGHLAGPNRIEGVVHTSGKDCHWYLTR